MLATLLLLLHMGQATITVTASVDRSPVPVGDEVIYSLRAVTTETGPIRAELPETVGLDEVERTERVDPVLGMAGGRAYVLDVRFRASRVGSWRLGPVLVFVGGAVESAPDVTVTVVASAGASNPAGNPRLMGLISRAPSPPGGSVATVAVVPSGRTAVRGEQLDVLTLAWFPRSIRVRLRRPPTLKPPVLTTVWSVPQPAVPGAVASVPAGGEIYDLFVSHQIVFPLTAGRLAIPPARVEYAVPISQRATSAERPVEATSDTVVVTVVEPAVAGRPPGFTGPVARDLQVAYRLRSLPARSGELLPVDLTVVGRGNMQFWPSPMVDWPPGTRAYLDGIDEVPRVEAGLLGGARTFRFLLLADSVGSVALPPVRYSYYDPARGSYREAAASGMVIPVIEGSTAAQRDPVALAEPAVDWSARADRFRPSALAWWVLLVSVPGMVAAWSLRRRPRPARPSQRPSALEQLERAFMVLAPDSGDRPPADVVASLRRAGVAAGVATELVDLRREVDRARFGPSGPEGHVGLAQAASRTLQRLPGTLRHRIGVVAVLLVLPGWAVGQQPAEAYRDGAFGAAADAFRAQAVGEAGRWQRWYNLAAAEYMAGHDAAAAVALAAARRLAPRARLPRELWQTLERAHEPLRVARPVVPLAPGERWLLVVGACWAGALLLGVRPRHRWSRIAAVGLPAAALALALAAGHPAQRRDGFLRSGLSVRQAPHGLAREQGFLPALALVRLERKVGDWLLIRDRGGLRGWVPRGAVATLPGVD